MTQEQLERIAALAQRRTALMEEERRLLAELGPGWRLTHGGLTYTPPAPKVFACDPDESGGVADA